ncbi:MAG: diacylglycerol kinase family lipid kinase [Bacteroidales bacterium]|nr:diacylglycerol kinase family lipid kinase [Bacteroidales bacterium]
MSKNRLLLIVNPNSGTVAKSRLLPTITSTLDNFRLPYDLVFTRETGHGRELARQAVLEGYRGVLACGGDGTVNEIGSALVGSDTAMGIVPCGSGNGLARHLGIPIDVEGSIRIISEDNIINADYATGNDTPFFCTCGMGFDAAVSQRASGEKKRGLAMYIRNAASEFVNFTPDQYIIECDGKELTREAFIVAVCNASQYGNNAFIAPQASITDGLLDVMVVRSSNILEHAMVGVDMLTGMIGNNTLVDSFRTTHLKITRKESGPVHFDGDSCQMPEVVDITCHPGALKLFASRRDVSFRPLVTPLQMLVRDVGLEIKHLFE